MLQDFQPDFRIERAETMMKRLLGAQAAGGVLLRLTVFLLLCFAITAPAQIPKSAISVREEGGNLSVWWRSSEAPEVWRSAIPSVVHALKWRKVRPGLESAHLELSGDHVGWRVRVILACFDPGLFSLQLNDRVIDSRPAWRIDSAPANSALALNAGQFEMDQPWGWLVRNAREIQPPRPGPLSSALVVDSTGRASIVDADEISGVRDSGNVVLAFQSYPAILVGDGRVPEPLRRPGCGVDLDHRDSRLAIGSLRDGRLIVALTRFVGIGSVLEQLPFGPTTPEMAAIMGSLGCRRAVLLDGGLSGQMLLQDIYGKTDRWPGLRSVPLGFVLIPLGKSK
jgi:hypothetical protein